MGTIKIIQNGTLAKVMDLESSRRNQSIKTYNRVKKKSLNRKGGFPAYASETVSNYVTCKIKPHTDCESVWGNSCCNNLTSNDGCNFNFKYTIKQQINEIKFLLQAVKGSCDSRNGVNYE